MKIFHYDTVKAQDAEGGAAKTTIRWLITKEIGAENFAMRLFEMEPSGHSPLHTHQWEHEVFILEGKGQLFDGAKSTPFSAGDVIFIPGNEQHQFKNTGQKLLRFLCLVPYTWE
ncbi:cupin domain-containing protein [Candidatus Bathyarchaeota archaeon A05DMB-2]|nr:cupin domain-containing protein [Candidatus Bathyarchaeota archaeon A05DMB-2]